MKLRWQAVFSLVSIFGGASAQRFLFTFGDSLSTTGFNISGPQPEAGRQWGNPGFPGITSDAGDNWVDVVMMATNDTLSYNFAGEAATVDNRIVYVYKVIPDFVAQVTRFLKYLSPAPTSARWNSANSVFCVLFGPNDVDQSYDDQNATNIVRADINALKLQLTRLQNAGARRFVVFNIPPLYRSPYWQSGGEGAANASKLASDISTWNKDLNSTVSAFRSSCSGCNIAQYDPTSTWLSVINNPTSYGAPNSSCYNLNGRSCVWTDMHHPGQAIQKKMGNDVIRVLKGLGYYNGVVPKTTAVKIEAKATPTP